MKIHYFIACFSILIMTYLITELVFIHRENLQLVDKVKELQNRNFDLEHEKQTLHKLIELSQSGDFIDPESAIVFKNNTSVANSIIEEDESNSISDAENTITVSSHESMSRGSNSSLNLSMLDDHEYIEKLTQFTNNKSVDELVEYANDDFQKESIDYPWAKDQEDIITAHFSSDDQLVNYSLYSAECRSTKCKLTVYVNDHQEANKMVGHIVDSLKENHGTESPSILVTPDIENNLTYLYLMRDGYRVLD